MVASRVPCVFISYTHESKAHKNWVKKLATSLLHNGIDVILDQWDLKPGADMTRFMEGGISDADRVLLVLTPKYCRKANQRFGGVGYESHVITGKLFEDLGTTKFIGVLRIGDDRSSVPEFLKSRLFIDARRDSEYNAIVKELIYELHDVPLTKKPKRGKSPFEKKLNEYIDTRVELTGELLKKMYSVLKETYGIENWWFRSNKFQICVEAILSQGTGWRNVELSIANLEEADALNPETIFEMPTADLIELIRPSGFFNKKATCIKSLVTLLKDEFDFSFEKLSQEGTDSLAEKLREIKGIGDVTRDNIILYVADKPKLPFNDRIHKVFLEHSLIKDKESYQVMQNRFESISNFGSAELREFDELIYHVKRDYCHSDPQCDICPLREILPAYGPKSKLSSA